MRKRDTVKLIGVLLVTTSCATTPPSDLRTEEHATVDTQGVQRVDVVAGSYWFRPDRIVVKANTPVLLSVKKEPGVVPHTFVIRAPQADINVDLHLGTEPKTARFTPTRAGDYPFYCSEGGLFGNHRKKGMQGILQVTE